MQQIIKNAALAFALVFLVSLLNGQVKSPASAFKLNNKSDIDKILKQVGNKSIVAIVEDTHGTKEYYTLRAEITRRLILEKGFNVFILENPHEDMLAFQDDLNSQSLDSLMSKHLFAIYQTKEMKEFLTWLKVNNKKGKIKLAGSDAQIFHCSYR